jgi:hypothetical protein
VDTDVHSPKIRDGQEIENVSVCPVVEDVSVSVQLRVCVPLTGVVGRLV